MPVRTKAKLCAAAIEHITMLGQYPERVVATFRTAAYAIRLNISQGRINNGRAGERDLVQARAEEPAIPDLRRSAVHEVTSVGA